jgi:hypothetical protein
VSWGNALFEASESLVWERTIASPTIKRYDVSMADEAMIQELMNADKSSVVEFDDEFGSEFMFRIHHYEVGLPIGESIIKGSEVEEFVRELRDSGRVVRTGWRIREKKAPDGWEKLDA